MRSLTWQYVLIFVLFVIFVLLSQLDRFNRRTIKRNKRNARRTPFIKSITPLQLGFIAATLSVAAAAVVLAIVFLP